ncbi:MAG: hypothetical protein ABW166_02240 [Sedimenticola sp.]
MPGSIKTTDARIDAFWEICPQVLEKFRVPDKALSWYRKHVQTFIGRGPETRLLEQTPVRVEAWLGTLGRNTLTPAW